MSNLSSSRPSCYPVLPANVYQQVRSFWKDLSIGGKENIHRSPPEGFLEPLGRVVGSGQGHSICKDGAMLTLSVPIMTKGKLLAV